VVTVRVCEARTNRIPKGRQTSVAVRKIASEALASEREKRGVERDDDATAPLSLTLSDSSIPFASPGSVHDALKSGNDLTRRNTV